MFFSGSIPKSTPVLILRPASRCNSRLQGNNKSLRAGIGFDAGVLETSGLPPAAAAAVGGIIELRLPLVALEIGEGGEFRLQMFWFFNGQPFQSIPAHEPLPLKVPGARDYAANWQV